MSSESLPPPQFWADLGERLLWTLIEAVAAVGIVVFGDLGYEWVPVITGALMGVKGLAAKRIGNKDSAAVSRTR